MDRRVIENRILIGFAKEGKPNRLYNASVIYIIFSYIKAPYRNMDVHHFIRGVKIHVWFL